MTASALPVPERSPSAAARFALCVAVSWVGLGCGAPAEPDAGAIVDSGADSGADAGTPDASVDAGEVADAGTPTDAGADGGTVGGGAATSAEIQAVLDASDGFVDLTIHRALVTYVKAEIGDGLDGAGFFLQAERAGPALYVAVDPASLLAPPRAGDVIDVRVVERATASDGSEIVYAAAVTDLRIQTRSNDLAFLVQDVTTVDLTADVASYAMELVELSGATIARHVAPCGRFVCFEITTVGTPSASDALRMRVPFTLALDLGLVEGCVVDVGPTPLWRHGSEAQPTAWAVEDIGLRSCPPPMPVPGAGDLVFTEIGIRWTGDDGGQQLLEIFNPSSDTAFDMSSCGLTLGWASWVLWPGLIIRPGQYLVLAGSDAETPFDYPIPPGLVLAEGDAIRLSCGPTFGVVDRVDWRVTGTPAIDDVTLQLDPAALASSDPSVDNDWGSRWCLTPTATYGTGRRGTPGGVNESCPPRCGAVATHLVINEIDYRSGVLRDEFVELYNPTAASIDLAGIALVLFDGATGLEYERVPLSGTLAPAGFAVVTAPGSSVVVPAGVPRFAFSGTGSVDRIRDSEPSGLALLDASDAVVDFVTHGGAFASDALLDPLGTELATIPVGLNVGVAMDPPWPLLPDQGSTSRGIDGCDTGAPDLDWVVAVSTPGARNVH